MKTATEFCQLVENKLGWAPPGHLPAFRRYQIEAAKVKRKIATNPGLFTWRNLELAVELLWRERQPRTPIGVFAHVERAVEKAVVSEEAVELQIREALKIEEHRGDPDGWVTRFARATGAFRREAFEEWRASRCS